MGGFRPSLFLEKPTVSAATASRRQVIANERRIDDGGRGAPNTAASCALRASISLASPTEANSSARSATMAEMVWLLLWREGRRLRAGRRRRGRSPPGVFSGRMWNDTGAPRRKGNDAIDQELGGRHVAVLRGGRQHRLKTASMLSAASVSKRARAALVKVMKGARRSTVSHSSNARLDTQ